MNARSWFSAAFWAGLAAPLLLFAAPSHYTAYPGAAALARHVGAVGAALSRRAGGAADERDAGRQG